MTRPTEYVTVLVDYVETRTDKAVLCHFDGRDVWLPLSVIDSEDDFEDGPIDVAEWFAEREGLPLFEGDRRDYERSRGGDSTAPGRPRRVPRERGLGRVTTAAFGDGELLRVEGDRSVVRFPDGRTRTLGSRYVKPR
jgi:hypothetical protein